MESTEFGWDELLDRIEMGNVIPVIGQGLYWVRTEENKDVLLYRHLADRLAQTMGHPSPEQSNHAFSKMVLQYLKERSNDYLGLRKFLIEELSSLYPIPEGPLWKLSRIKPFSLFINTTYDHFLEQILNSIRIYPTEVLYHTHKEKRTDRVTPQMSDNLKDSRGSLLLHIYGSAAKNMVPAYTENDMLETVVEFQKDMDKEPRNPLFQALKEKSLLFIGCGYDDWLSRFFIRTIANEPYQPPSDLLKRRYICDDFEAPNLGELEPFLKSHYSHVFFSRDHKGFVNRLFDKVKNEHIIPEEEFPDTAFISFHGKDREIAVRLASELRKDGVKVWLDQSALRPGDRVDETIIKAIDKCTVFIPLISESTKQFQRNEDVVNYHIREWERAYTQHLRGKNPTEIMPVKIDNTDWMYEPFKKKIFISIPGGNSGGDYLKLKESLLRIQNNTRLP